MVSCLYRAIVWALTQLCQKLVELIPAIQTSTHTLDRARAFAIACGKGEPRALLLHDPSYERYFVDDGQR